VPITTVGAVLSDAPARPNYLVGDSLRLRQIIANLLGNAIKFTKEGEVVVRGELAAARDNEVELHFAVRDTSIGIPPDKQRMIFEAFT
jgi:signal transduction histidine kinase